MNKILTQNRHLQIGAALLVADFIVFTAIDPRRASAVWLISGYVLLGFTVFTLLGAAAQLLKAYGARTHALGGRALRYGAAATTAIIGLQSIGQLTFKDVAMLLPLVAGAYIYVSYGRKLATNEP